MASHIQNSLKKLINRQNLSLLETEEVMNDIMTGQCSEAQIAAWLTALLMKGETSEEIAAGINIMRRNVLKVPCPDKLAIDIVGTGGDGIGTWNISTTATFVAAGAGVTIAKHGNRALSSRSGSADVLSCLGINTGCSVETIANAINLHGIAFLFAPLFHPAMKYTVGPRKEMAIRTVFNLLGPMTNPAGVRRGLIGVYNKNYCRLLAEAAQKLGEEHIFFVHGADGLDEISVTAATFICEVKNGTLKEYSISPEEFGFKKSSLDELIGGTPEQNAAELKAILSGKKGAYRDAVLLNTAFAIFTTGKYNSINDALSAATNSIDSGAALNKLEALKIATNS